MAAKRGIVTSGSTRAVTVAGRVSSPTKRVNLLCGPEQVLRKGFARIAQASSWCITTPAAFTVLMALSLHVVLTARGIKKGNQCP